MIELKSISKRFFDFPVISNASLHIEKGESVVILGQSGVGKSVLLKLIAGILEPDQGRVRIASSNIGMLFQKNALFDSLTIEENLDFPLQEKTLLNTNQRKEKIAQYLTWVGLSHALKQYPAELSGGMQKRLGIARALIVEPEVLLYDEPTAGLDPITSRVIADLMLRLKQELGTTIVTVTSDVLRGLQLADRIALLIGSKKGAHLKVIGTPKEVQSSADLSVQQFIQGKTKGPLTEKEELTTQTKHSLAQKIAKHAESFDVDYF